MGYISYKESQKIFFLVSALQKKIIKSLTPKENLLILPY